MKITRIGAPLMMGSSFAARASAWARLGPGSAVRAAPSRKHLIQQQIIALISRCSAM